jgi:hypothetical protein
MNATHRTIRLSAKQLEYLKSANFLPASLGAILDTAQYMTTETCSISVSQDTAEEFRSVFTERLARAGFDISYELTDEGRVLEDLIDRFHLT